jgi:Na+-transporting NADH:ubiquinone oxidoreductase subunit B
VTVTLLAPHLRDGLDLRRATTCLLAAVAPSALAGVTNAGHQALLAARELGLARLPGWRGALFHALGLPSSPDSLPACFAYGLSCAVPMLAVAAGVGWAWDRVFVRLRDRAPCETLPAVVVLFCLLLPPGIALWQVAAGASVAHVVGLAIFGGTGRNPVHPVLVGFTFLYFAYPASFSAPGAWVALDGARAEPALVALAGGSLSALELSWADTLLGRTPGGLGETSALACLLGGAFLVYAQLASWRVIAGGALGLVAAAALANAFGDPERPLVGVPGYWHLGLGSFAFGLVFLATDPVTSAATRAGRWVYGALIGGITVLVRVFNPALAEGALIAIVLANVLAPLLDHGVVALHLRRRRRRLG